MGKYAFHTKQTFTSFMGTLCFLINKTMHIYTNTLNMNNFTPFKMHLKIIKCYKSFIM